MARFVFKLQAVLRQRELIEDTRQREFAVVQAKYAELEAQLRAMDEEMKSATEDLRRNHLIGPIDLAYLTAHRRFTLAMQKRALAHAERMAVAKQAVDAARAKLVEAARDRKAMEKLRETRLAAWTADQNRKEQAATDEISNQLGVKLIRGDIEL